ncbi:MAG: hypothetical protein EOP83_10180 [Verrucomicrobiaceae bacterium]|nr:MAG: hypothetical protein EOP83_10180 [Verrucomicrobiaceae bacterium]
MKPFFASGLLITMLMVSSCSAESQVDEEKTGTDWLVRKTTTASACAVQPEGELPTLGVEIARRPNLKGACEAAHDLHDAEMSDSKRCWTYTQGAINRCKSAGITLP